MNKIERVLPNIGEERRTTIIEQLAAAYQDALGGSYLEWSQLDAGHRRQHVVAMTAAIALLPDGSLYSLRDGTNQFVPLRGVRDGMVEEQAIKDERRCGSRDHHTDDGGA